VPDRPREEQPAPAQGRLVVLVCVLLIAAQLAFRGWAVLGSWFQFDDVVFISRLYDQPWSWDLVGAGYAGHFMPAGLTLTWLFVQLDPLGFTPYALTLLGLQTLASVGFLLLLRSLFGARWGIVPALAVYLFSAITLNAFIWWAAGVNQLALQVALAWGLLCHVAYLRSGRFRWVLATVAVIVVCLAFYEKVLLVYGAIAIVTLAWFTSGGARQRLAQVWARYRAGLVAHVLTGLAFIAVYVQFALTLPDTGGKSLPAAGLIGNMVTKAWLPAMFGGPLDYSVLAGPFQLVDPADTVLLLTLLLAVAFVVHVDRTFLRSRRAWLLPLFFVLADLGLVAAARASVIGSTIGLEFRYVTELGMVTPLAAAFATMAVRGAVETVEPRPGAAPSPLLANREVMALATAVVVGLSLVSSLRFVDHWRGSKESRDYFANADRTLGSPDDPTPLVNVSVPQYLMWGFDYPRNTNKYVLAMYGDRFTFPDVAQDDIFVIDDDGIVRSLRVAPVVTTDGPEEGCVDRLTAREPVTLPLTDMVDGTDWWARLPYATKQATGVRIEAGDTTHEVTLEPGLRNLYFRADGHFDEVTLTLTGPGRWVCVGNLSLGFPQPLEPGDDDQSGSAAP
jgi:hypothetical protein